MSGLVDFLQGASNAAASNVSGPVDLISWLLRKGGMGGVIGDAPVGSSAWMAQRGLTRQTQGAAGLLGEAAGLSAPIAAAAKAPQIAAGLLKMGENAAAPTSALNAQRGAIVYHGSPHKFDRFDASKIGTGEGAQAYGHGLYLAESPAVANTYKEALSSPALSVRGREVRTTAGTAMDTAKAWLDDVYERGFFNSKTANPFDQAIRDVQAAPVPNKQDVIDALQRLKSANATMAPGGNLYKVDLPDDMIARMLDWDKPLSQQAPGVREALSGLADVAPVSALKVAQRNRQGVKASSEALFGNDAYMNFGGYNNGREASELLRRAGIPGIRYLDGGSRGTGVGTSNFVVFPGEETALQILQRNGLMP